MAEMARSYRREYGRHWSNTAVRYKKGTRLLTTLFGLALIDSSGLVEWGLVRWSVGSPRLAAESRLTEIKAGRWPGVSAGLSLSEGRPAHAGPRPPDTLTQMLIRQADRRSIQPTFLAPDVQFAATASRSPSGVAARSASPNLDPVTTHMGWAPTRKMGEK